MKVVPYDIKTVRDWVAFQNRFDLLRQTIQNGASEFGKRCPVPSAVSTTGYYYGLVIPPGRRLHIWRRDLVLSQGAYDVDLVRFPDGFTGGTLAFRSNLYQGGAVSVGTQLFCGVTPVGTGTVVMELPRVDTGTAQTGQARVAGAAAVDGVLKSFTTGDVLIRVRRTEAAAYSASIQLIAWEEPEE